MVRGPGIPAAVFVERALVVAIVGLTSLIPATSLAHEGRDVGLARMSVGWASEPPLEGETNAIELRATNPETGQPLTSLEQTVQVQIRFGEARTTKGLDAVPGSPGLYRVPIVPTRSGKYEIAIRGTIGPELVDESFELDRVEGAADLQFPEQVPSPRESARVVRAVQGAALVAQDVASSARILAVIGVGLGLLSVVGVAVVAVAMRRDRSKPS